MINDPDLVTRLKNEVERLGADPVEFEHMEITNYYEFANKVDQTCKRIISAYREILMSTDDPIENAAARKQIEHFQKIRKRYL